MRNMDNLHNVPDLNILEKIFFQFYSEKICEVPESKEQKKHRKMKQKNWKPLWILWTLSAEKNISNTKVPVTVWNHICNVKVFFWE